MITNDPTKERTPDIPESENIRELSYPAMIEACPHENFETSQTGQSKSSWASFAECPKSSQTQKLR